MLISLLELFRLSTLIVVSSLFVFSGMTVAFAAHGGGASGGGSGCAGECEPR